MKKVYIAAAFRKFTDRTIIQGNRAYGVLSDGSYTDFLESIESVFADFGFYTCLPHRDEGLWGKVYFEPSAISALCFRHVATSDVLFAIAEEGRGVHLEIGYASGLGSKTLILAYQKDKETSTLLWGLNTSITPWTLANPNSSIDIHYLPYADHVDLLEKLDALLLSMNYSKLSSLAIRHKRAAIIDIGSHTLKFKVFEVKSSGFLNQIYADKISISIIDDLTANNHFSEETTLRLVIQLNLWRTKCDELSIDIANVATIATAAFRLADNADHVLATIRKDCDLNPVIVTGETELKYIWNGIINTFVNCRSLAVLNLGGGSVHCAISDNQGKIDTMLYGFGTKQLVDAFPWDGPLSQRQYAQLLENVSQRFIDLSPSRLRATYLVHTGGELEFLLKCRVPMDICELSPRHVSQISIDNFKRFSRQFSTHSREEIAKVYNLDPAWLIGSVASNAIAICLAEALGCKYIIPSNMNIADGLFYEMLGQTSKVL